ncbi:oligosaccharide flippase family protein [Promicromonospora sp. CA-289599]|uniref:oligosaccharide flippase family protein n=1 Tax=Promicromonospora sp. CA-289599 TaxID=3240014 RepID=UPI003D8CEDC4
MTTAPLGTQVRSGLLWSALNNATLRLGTLITGIFLARILDPETFGVFAVAATVQGILMTVSELGLAADLVRRGRFDERGPTIATLSLVSSGLLTAAMWFGAPAIAEFMGAVEAAPAVRAMSLTLLLAGIGVVPFARLQRDLRQRELFLIELVAFVVSTTLAVGLALAGWGAMAIAVGRLCSMIAVVVLEFATTRTLPRFGWRSDVASSGFRFGFPLACAGLLSLVLLNIDNVLVGRLGGPVLLGLYSLAFNVSSWPSSVIGTAVRAVAMPAFARRSDDTGTADRDGLVTASSLTWALAVPVSMLLGTLAGPVIEILYGHAWAAAAGVLAWLAAVGAFRILFDVWVAYLTAGGWSGKLLRRQGLWLVALAPVMWWGVGSLGLVGAGAAHLVVVTVIVLPAFLHALHGTGVRLRRLVVPLLVPVAAVVPAAAVVLLVRHVAPDAWVQLTVGGVAGFAAYAALVWPWLARLLPAGVLPGQALLSRLTRRPRRADRPEPEPSKDVVP